MSLLEKVIAMQMKLEIDHLKKLQLYTCSLQEIFPL